MDKLSCIGVSLAARIIGTYTMSLSILMINLVMSNFFSRKGDEEFFDSCKIWAVLGLNWMQILRNTQLQKKAQTAMTCFLVYALLFLLASACLALGSMSRRHKCAVPWMYLQMISIIDQSVALSIHLTHSQQQYDVLEKSMWYVPVSSIYLILSVYLWVIVQAARKQWFNEQQDHVDYVTTISSTLSTPVNSCSKTPSFLSQNFSMFESPRPPTTLLK
ncbi:PREDICTED: uncharacterized protein LOC106744757 [Dinoponera quadriceps]|uniref:Uncharacterized protein LOC106744757 n=1 Tax=Dinoponera quadriceps TaxID=609295 RepID=A0A6P3XAH5_DINQU|nr:PREDICTED: uncharacterized protein LOC106744757 [Dinoponera quadriceps]